MPHCRPTHNGRTPDLRLVGTTHAHRKAALGKGDTSESRCGATASLRKAEMRRRRHGRHRTNRVAKALCRHASRTTLAKKRGHCAGGTTTNGAVDLPVRAHLRRCSHMSLSLWAQDLRLPARRLRRHLVHWPRSSFSFRPPSPPANTLCPLSRAQESEHLGDKRFLIGGEAFARGGFGVEGGLPPAPASGLVRAGVCPTIWPKGPPAPGLVLAWCGCLS